MPPKKEKKDIEEPTPMPKYAPKTTAPKPAPEAPKPPERPPVFTATVIRPKREGQQ